jgi:hypothetical protein
LAQTQRHQRYRNHFERHVRDFLRPEMFNRIDRILTYDPLQEATVQQIAKLRLTELQSRDGWKGSGGQLDVQESAIRQLAHDGYQVQYGARPLARELEARLVAPLSEAICDSGRLARLSVNVGVKQTGDQQQIAVSVQSQPRPSRVSEDSSEGLIQQITLLRRRSQALDRCDAVRRMRNQYTIVTRKIKALIRAADNDNAREKIRYGPLGASRLQHRQRIEQIKQLCQDINDAEADVLKPYYRGQPIDVGEFSNRLQQLRDRLWQMLCELHSESAIHNQRMTLIITGPNLAPAHPLLEAYRFVATQRGWNLQVYGLLRRDSGSSHDRVIDCDGWGQEPAFRVATERDRVAEMLTELVDERDKAKPSLAAYRLLRFNALTAMPSGTLGVMMTFRGKAASLSMSGESGVHTFNRLQQAKSAGQSILIRTFGGLPIEYIAPDWLADRDFQMSGNPRRWYDFDNDLVQDMTDAQSRSIKMDRQGRWLDLLIEQESERRIWAQLDEQDAANEEPVDDATVVISN